MRYYPPFEDFVQKAREGNLIPVYREILADLETPVSAFLKIDQGEYSFLLESVEGGEKWGRYCFLGNSPRVIFRAKGKRVEVWEGGRLQKEREVSDPLEALKELLAGYRPVVSEGLPRFFGGAVGYLGYDMVRFFEELPDLTEDDLNLEDALFILTDNLLIFDNMNHKIKIVHNVFLRDEDLAASYGEAIERIEETISLLKRPLDVRKSLQKGRLGAVPYLANFQSRTEGKDIQSSALSTQSSLKVFQEAIVQAKEYIQAGEIIQVVLSQRLQMSIACDPFDIYRALRTINPSPYMFYLKFGDLKLVGSSPEVLVRMEGEVVEVRPIAGTRPRGQTESEDLALAGELMEDPKELAEHIMLVDLGRNDVGRVSRMGTVKVDQLMVIEKYSHVMHIVSNVRGQRQPDKDCFDVMRACFPAGTVSGAPKIRAMEIIEELEPTRRGPYAGAVGYFSFSGNMDTCIAIRTLVVKGQTGYLQVGAGIVADSQPDKEYEETLNKGRAMLKAIEMAEEGW